jgi:hypothetical protein
MTDPQCTETPPELIAAVESRFGPIVIDLCASRDNVCPYFITPEADSINENWVTSYKDAEQWVNHENSHTPTARFAWCNPPFGNQAPFLAKLAERKIPALCIIPYDSATKHWRKYVSGIARVEVLQSRVKFVGHSSAFPKPIALLVYEPGVDGAEGGCWDWRWTKR